MSRALLLALLAALLLFPSAAACRRIGCRGEPDLRRRRKCRRHLPERLRRAVQLRIRQRRLVRAGRCSTPPPRERPGRRPHFRGRSRPAATTSSSSHRTRTSAPRFRPRTRPARATSAAPAGKSRSFVVLLHSRAALRRGVARPTHSWRISSATAVRATSRVRARRRRFQHFGRASRERRLH